MLHSRQGTVRIPQRVGGRLQTNTRRACFGKQRASIIARVGGDAAQLAFLIKMAVVVKGWNVAEMYARDRAGSSPIKRFQRRRNQTARRSEQNRRIHHAREITAINTP